MRGAFLILPALVLFSFTACCQKQAEKKTEPVPHALEIPEPASNNTGKRESFETHMENLRKKVPDGFTVQIEKPFVVIGNDTPSTVLDYSTNTVKWAVDLLKKDYFTKDPGDIIDIWLFKDRTTYLKYARELFNDTPSTPFGYYSPHHKSLIMNIKTGGGTLVHEIVHPFMHANFPECPDWFNEGLASLYEQCGEKNGHIYGYTNWRLAGLKKIIQNNTIPSFKDMFESDFYNEDKADNYAQARYLCYYIQRQGKLVEFYHAFRKNVRTDPTGYETLVKTLGITDMDTFEKDWKKFCLKLVFNG